MPTYTYKREDGTTFEFEQRITEAALTTCPTTGMHVKRIIRGAGGLVFKGSGFYQTDYPRSGGAAKTSSAGASEGSSEKPAEKVSATPSTPAAPASSSSSD
ncbi:MAG: FmdB family zinc ribbon protein [Rhodothermales bacterium]|nr:FmdB family zinc ribbon protein [Rhodothermales bacterium]